MNCCTNCGGSIDANANFCRHCGSRLFSAAPALPGNEENRGFRGRSILKWTGIGCGGVVAAIVLLVITIGCSLIDDDEPNPEPAALDPTPASRPTAAPAPEPTATLQPTYTPVPTYTPQPTYTPLPTSTPYPTPTIPPTFEPTFTPQPTYTPAPTYTPIPTSTLNPTATLPPTPEPTVAATPTVEAATEPTTPPALTDTPEPEPNMPVVTIVGRTSDSIEIQLSTRLGQAVDRYQVFHRSPGASDFTLVSDNVMESHYGHSGIASDSTHYYKARACNSIGCSEFSAESAGITEKTGSVDPPSTPTGVSGWKIEESLETDAAGVTWNPVAGATYYQIRQEDKLDGEVSAPQGKYYDGSPNTFFGAFQTTSYSVRACNKAGCSSFSSWVVVR